MIISFFGHSNYLESEDDECRVLSILDDISKGEQVDFYLGGYGSFDYFALHCAKKFKEKHPDAKLYLICPYMGKWLDDRQQDIERDYDASIYPEIEHVPLKFAISKRNEWIGQQADYIIAYVNKHYGGAYKALLYAHKHNKPYTNLYKGNYELY